MHGLPGRVQAPNSRSRAILVVALDRAASARLHALAGATALRIAEGGGLPALDSIDAVLAVTVAGTPLEGIAPLASACAARGLALTGIILPGSGEAAALPFSLGQLRNSVRTLLVATADEDVSELAEALRGRE